MARAKSKTSKLQPMLLATDTDFSGERQAIVTIENYPTFTIEDICKLEGHTFAIDTETTGLLWYKDKVLGIGIYCPDILVGYLPVSDPKLLGKFHGAVKSLSSKTTMVGHNLKFDCHFMGLAPAEVRAAQYDTVMLDHTFDSRGFKVQGGHNKKLGTLEKIWLGTKSKLAFSDPLDKKNLASYPPGMVAPYCINDCRVTLDIYKAIRPKLEQMGLWALCEKDSEFGKVLWKIERRGLQLDREQCLKAIAQLEKDQAFWEQELFSVIGYEFKWRSNAILSRELYDKFPWPRPINPFLSEDGQDHTRFAARGRYNTSLTDSMILKEKAGHPLADVVLNLRETGKILDYYTDFMEHSDAEGVHTNFNQGGTRTRRLSSDKPNLQNLASDVRSRSTQIVHEGAENIEQYVRTEVYNPRLALVARSGYRLVSIDYKQMEMRMFGVIAGEQAMIDALRTGADIHSLVATMVWGSKKGEPIHEIHREWSKTIGFGLIYAMTTGALQLRLDMTEEQANKIAGDYTNRFKRIRPWLKEIMAECKRMTYVRYSSGAIWREDNEIDMYKGANAVIQGPCGDLFSIAATRCQRYLDEVGYGFIVNLVHDEIVFELPEDKLNEAIPALRSIMQVSDLLLIPFFTDAKVGDSFGDMHSWTPN